MRASFCVYCVQFWLNHANIVRVHGVLAPSGNGLPWSIVMERASTSLLSVLASRPSLWLRVRWAREVAAAMRYCHSHRPVVLHLDLKSANVLIVGEGDARFAKVADFGTARILESTQQTIAATTLHVTYQWAAPELLEKNEISTSADVYSYGVVLWELLIGTGELPYAAEKLTPFMLSQKIVHNELRLSPDTFHDAPADMVLLMKQCTSFKASARPTFDAVHRRLAQCDELAFVFRFDKPSKQLIDSLMACEDDDENIADVAVVRRRNGTRSLIVLPSCRYRNRDVATQSLNEFCEIIDNGLNNSNNNDDDDGDVAYEHCTVDPLDRYAFLGRQYLFIFFANTNFFS